MTLYRWVRTWTRFDVAWLAWILAGMSIEFAALRDARSGGTLSDAWWWLTSNGREARGAWRLVRIVALCLTAWAIVHLWARRNFI